MNPDAFSYKIRKVEGSDLAAIEEIEKACFSVPWTLSQLEAYSRSENCIFLLAENENNGILGYAGCQTVLDEGYIANIAVSPAHRRRKAADALIAAMISAAKKRGLAFLTLEVRESNAPAVALYEKHGFVLVGKRRDYYERPREDALLMTLFI